MKLAFMGTPDFSVDILQALVDGGHDVVAVYSQPPSRSGRGKKHRPSPVHQLADSLNIPVHCPKSLKSDEEQQTFSALDLDAAVVVAYGLILPQAILDAPKHGCLNIHASLLPRWRGAAPIHRAIMAGDAETGVNIMVMEAGLDTGPVILERRLPILATDTTGSLHDKLKALGAEAILPALEGFVSGDLAPVAQSEDGVTYAHKIDKQEAPIDWTRPAEDLRNHIHGLSPFPGAYSLIGELRIKMLDTEIVDGSGTISSAAGQLIALPMTIACGDGRALKILTAQRAGKGPMTAEDLNRGLQLTLGTVFS
ncbi:MAG: methionyl-tRNA formyltransferase [Alphaproteobacteria bacterium]|nr:MAG: methionyl-tRNA formyltransferase [Alphaproteobacteria bacterium]